MNPIINSRVAMFNVAPRMISAALKHQLEKWGMQDHPDLDPVLVNREGGATPERHAENLEIPTANRAKQNEQAYQKNWGNILVEEVAEAVEQAALKNRDALQQELAQIAAVCIQWINCIEGNKTL